MNNKLGEGISEAERTKIEETEAFQLIKDIKIEIIKIKDRIIIRTTKIAADMVIISIEEAIEGEITLEAIIEETSRITNNNFNNSNSQQQRYQNNETTVNTGNSGGHIETTAFSKKVCYSCGYPNHTSGNCEARGKSSTRGGQIPFNSQPKN